MDKYLDDITYIHHVVHSPTVRLLVDDIYVNIERPANAMSGKLALLLSIIASATYSWTCHDNNRLFISSNEANRQSTAWIKVTLDVLDYSRRSTLGTLEDIQAMIILSFLISSLEGLSKRYRDLMSSAVALARQLSLHRIDDHCSSVRPFPEPDSIQAEIGRRVWSYVAATDW